MGPDTDIPGPEISAGSRVMSWWFDEYSKYKGFSPACVTGAIVPAALCDACSPASPADTSAHPCIMLTELTACSLACQ